MAKGSNNYSGASAGIQTLNMYRLRQAVAVEDLAACIFCSDGVLLASVFAIDYAVKEYTEILNAWARRAIGTGHLKTTRPARCFVSYLVDYRDACRQLRSVQFPSHAWRSRYHLGPRLKSRPLPNAIHGRQIVLESLRLEHSRER